jgi:hypothetical protein
MEEGKLGADGAGEKKSGVCACLCVFVCACVCACLSVFRFTAVRASGCGLVWV